MELREVLSSNIKSVGYDGNDLIVEYKTGVRYKYSDVPRQLYEELLTAESKGTFVNKNIKPSFKYEKIGG